MRDEVTAFAEAMELRMAENDSEKGEDGWKSLDTPEPLLERLRTLTAALDAANSAYQQARGRKVPRPDLERIRRTILETAVDVGNYAMLIADVCNALPDPDPVIPDSRDYAS